MRREIAIAMAMVSLSGPIIERSMVVTDNLNVVDADGKVIEVLHKGDNVAVRGGDDNWTEVQTSSGASGWVSSAYLKESDVVIEEQIGYINKECGVNVRTDPDESSGLLWVAEYGDKVIILNREEIYTKIKLSNGTEGWILTQAISDTLESKDINNEEEEEGVDKVDKLENNVDKVEVYGSDIQRTATARVKVNVNGSLNVRTHPDINSAIMTTLKGGTIVERTGSSNGWVRVKLPNGKTGWVLGKYVSATSSKPAASTGARVKINYKGNLIVRSGPSSSRSIVTRVKGGTVVNRTGSSGDWVRIVLSDGKTGWVQKKYVSSIRTNPNPGTLKYRVNVSGSLNMRQYASLNAPIIGRLSKGNIVERLGINGDWLKIKYNGKIGWVSMQYLELTSSDRTQSNVVSVAKSKLGCKYKWGAAGPNEFDCSGFTYWVFAQVGKSIPRVSKDQANGGLSVSRGNLKPGDIVCFATGSTSTVSHVGIYIGNNQFIHASGTKANPKTVMISNMTGYYDRTYKCARRY